MLFTRAFLLAFFALCHSLTAGGEGWTTDFAAAQKQAAKEGKTLLVDFTGTDWCTWCIKLNDDIFQKEAFQEFASEHFILVELDYPRDKSGQSAELIAQNQELREQYKPKGFPTVLLLDAEGVPFEKTGYTTPDPALYVEQLEKMLEGKKRYDTAMTEAQALTGKDKAMALANALYTYIPDELYAFHQSTLDEIKTLDPDDTTGFQHALAAQRAFDALKKEIGQAYRADTPEAFAASLQSIQQYIATYDPTGQQLISLQMLQLKIQNRSRSEDEKVDAIRAYLAANTDLPGATQQELLYGIADATERSETLSAEDKLATITDLSQQIHAIGGDSWPIAYIKRLVDKVSAASTAEPKAAE